MSGDNPDREDLNDEEIRLGFHRLIQSSSKDPAKHIDDKLLKKIWGPFIGEALFDEHVEALAWFPGDDLGGPPRRVPWQLWKELVPFWGPRGLQARSPDGRELVAITVVLPQPAPKRRVTTTSTRSLARDKAIQEFAEDYMRAASRPSKRGLLRAAKDKGLLATELELLAKADALGIHGKAGAPNCGKK